MKVDLVLLLKWEDLHWTKAQTYPWYHNLLVHPSSIYQLCLEQLINDPSQIIFSTGSLNTKPPTLLLLLLQYLHIQFSASLNAWFQYQQKGGRGVEQSDKSLEIGRGRVKRKSPRRRRGHFYYNIKCW